MSALDDSGWSLSGRNMSDKVLLSWLNLLFSFLFFSFFFLLPRLANLVVCCTNKPGTHLTRATINVTKCKFQEAYQIFLWRFDLSER